MVRFLACSFFDRSEARVTERQRGSECLKEREIDDLIFGRLRGEDQERCLAHLLWCGECQERVEEEREFAQVTRDAAKLLDQQESAARGVARGRAEGLGRWISAWPWITSSAGA